MPIELPPETPEERAWREEILDSTQPFPGFEQFAIPDLTKEEADEFLAILEEL